MAAETVAMPSLSKRMAAIRSAVQTSHSSDCRPTLLLHTPDALMADRSGRARERLRLLQMFLQHRQLHLRHLADGTVIGLRFGREVFDGVGAILDHGVQEL